ncbi:MAG TPA: integrase, partial [Nitrosomonas sp.]|nr:integrase [Nitrosomonas sp.]
MRNHFPQIEVTPPLHRAGQSLSDSPSWLKSKRMLIFLIAFAVTAVISMSYVLGRSSIYRSHATLLTMAKTAIDQRSVDVDLQHVAIQKQLLLGADMLAEIIKTLQSHPEVKTQLTASDIRSMLDVQPVAETNLVEIVAEGPDPKILPILVNTWLDVYLKGRENEIARATGDTTQRIQTEISGLTEKINQKRIELELFRENNHIVSTGREENEALSRLKGLNDSLNKAIEEEVKAKARLDSIKKSIAKGQAVVPKEDTQKLAMLEKRAQELKEELADLDRRYTREYMALTPSLKVIPEKIATLQTEIDQLRSAGQRIVLSEAEQEYVAALQTTQAIRDQLEAHKKKAADFTARFTEHEALKIDLEGFEQRLRETQERLIQIETKYGGKFPQVDVVERAAEPLQPIWPDYSRDSLIALIGSLIMGLIAVWVVEFLTRKEKAKLAINLSGVHIYGGEESAREVVNQLPMAQQRTLAQQSVQPALIGGVIQEIAPQKIHLLFQAGNNKEQQLMALLLSGLMLDEIAAL